MKSKSVPTVPRASVIIINYNGRHLLEECLPSVLNQDLPLSDYEVILVDNNSSDDSVPFLRSNFPEVTLIVNEQNTGFTGGNQKGFEAAKSDNIVLLNSDVKVASDWLSELLKMADSDSKIGIVNSRLRYWYPCIQLDIISEVVPKSQLNSSTDHSPIGALLEDVVCDQNTLTDLIYYQSGFYEKSGLDITTRRTKALSSILLPIDPTRDELNFTFTFHGFEVKDAPTLPIKLQLGHRVLAELNVAPFKVKQFTLLLHPDELKPELKWLIQNAGNIVLHNGYSKDRGDLIKLTDKELREFYELESSYFDRPTELLAACGASCLIKRAVIDHVGFLNGHYFMYYEDVEFSLRAWRTGWKTMYQPTSVGYHKHRASTGGGETSFFLKQVERNHLALVTTHFPWQTVVSEYWAFSLRLMAAFLKHFVFQFRDDMDRTRVWGIKFDGRKLAALDLALWLPRLLKERYFMASHWPVATEKWQKVLY